MKKVLIIASAVIFAASTTVMASAQIATTKVQPQKTIAATKQEPQKAAEKAEMKAPAPDMKSKADPGHSKKHHKGGREMKNKQEQMKKENQKAPAAPPAKTEKAASPIRK